MNSPLLFVISVLGLLLGGGMPVTTPPPSTSPAEPGGAVRVTLKHGTADEAKTKEQLDRLLRRYDLDRWMFTRDVVIDEKVIPHSHPVLTLHTRHLGADDLLLSTFLHEEIHWFLEARSARLAKARAELKALYPKVPVGFPQGANDEESTYDHLLVVLGEWQGIREVLGLSRAQAAMNFWRKDHYRWVYATVLADEAKLQALARRNDLEVPTPPRGEGWKG